MYYGWDCPMKRESHFYGHLISGRIHFEKDIFINEQKEFGIMLYVCIAHAHWRKMEQENASVVMYVVPFLHLVVLVLERSSIQGQW
jgi:hypothetical protein